MARTQRRTAKHVALYYGGVRVADAYECTVEVSLDLIEHRAFGDNWKQREVDLGDWKITGKKYCASSDIPGMALGEVATEANSTDENVIALNATAYAVQGDESTKIISGPVYMNKATLAMSNGKMIDEDFELTSAGDPDFVAGV